MRSLNTEPRGGSFTLICSLKRDRKAGIITDLHIQLARVSVVCLPIAIKEEVKRRIFMRAVYLDEICSLRKSGAASRIAY
jgi:hypothetical protein